MPIPLAYSPRVIVVRRRSLPELRSQVVGGPPSRLSELLPAQLLAALGGLLLELLDPRLNGRQGSR